MKESLLSAINNRLMQGVSFSEICELYGISSSTLYRLDREGLLAECFFSDLNHKKRHIASQLLSLRAKKGVLLNIDDIKEYPKYCPVHGQPLTYLNEDPVRSATVVIICGNPYIVGRLASYLFDNYLYEDLQKLFAFVNKIKAEYDD